ncbi:thiamine pyrophosphate-dependent dehydrogenase E1 component subunit alpha [Chloroflexota bacterium]
MLDADTLYSLLYSMLRIRKVEERIAELYPEQEMRCPVHLCIGQEAIAAGVCANLSHDDYVLSNHRSHGHYLAKGGDLKAMIAEIYGKATGASKGRGGSQHLIDLSANVLGTVPLVGGTIPVAVGAAFASVMQDKGNVAVVFFGDGAVEEGVFHESLNFASLKNLPVIFVCENNLYAVHTPLSERQPQREIFSLAKGHAVDTFQVDGNDAIEIYKMAKDAVSKAKNGGGPTFLECKTYRLREHCGPNYDADIGYRGAEEIEDWQNRDPIEKLKIDMMNNDITLDEKLKKMTKEIEGEIEEAVIFARESPFPQPDQFLKHIYSD